MNEKNIDKTIKNTLKSIDETSIDTEMIDPINNGYVDQSVVCFIRYVNERIKRTASYSNSFFQEKSLESIKQTIEKKLNSNNIDPMDIRVLEDLLNDVDYLFSLEKKETKKSSR